MKASQSTNAGVLEAVDVHLANDVAHKKGEKIFSFPKRAGVMLVFCALLSVSFARPELRGEKAAIGASSTCPRPELRVMPQCVRRRPETHRVTPPKPMADVSPKAPSSKAQHASICRFRHPPSPTQSKS
eukprot:47076_1